MEVWIHPNDPDSFIYVNSRGCLNRFDMTDGSIRLLIRDKIIETKGWFGKVHKAVESVPVDASYTSELLLNGFRKAILDFKVVFPNFEETENGRDSDDDSGTARTDSE